MPEDASQVRLPPGEAARSLLAAPPKLAVLAAACMALALFLPVLSYTVTVFGVPGPSGTVTGAGAAGWAAWVAALAFALAAWSRFAPALAPYAGLLDLAAFGTTALAVVWAALGGPVAADLWPGHAAPVLRGADGASIPPMASASFHPSLGAVPFVLAPVLLALAKRRERRRAP